MTTQFDKYLLQKYLPRDSEDYFQARTLTIIMGFFAILIAGLLPIIIAPDLVKLMLVAMIVISLITIVAIKAGHLSMATAMSITGMGAIAFLTIFFRDFYQGFEVYTVVTFQIFIVIVSSLLTRQRFFTYFSVIAGLIYLLLLLFIRAIPLSTPEMPLEIDDYIICAAMLILTGYVSRSTLERRQKLLEIAENEATQHHQTSLKLQESLDEKDILLQEIHHRVKNNLNVAISLLRLQMDALRPSDQTAIKALEESIGRLYAMAIIHERLYTTGDFTAIDFGPYLQIILQAAISAVKQSNVHFDIQVADTVKLELTRAIPCGLIINELITNVFKHAYPNGSTGHARIELATREENILMRVTDDGVGIPDQENLGSNSLGMKIIHLLTEQLDGTLTIDGQQGTTVTLIFPKDKETDDVSESSGSG